MRLTKQEREILAMSVPLVATSLARIADSLERLAAEFEADVAREGHGSTQEVNRKSFGANARAAGLR